MKRAKEIRGTFTDAWKEAIEASGVSIDFWAVRIGAKPSQLIDWLRDSAVPEAHCLRLFVVQIQEYPDQAPFQKFYDVLNEPSWKVSPLDNKMHPSIGHWMLAEYRKSLNAALATLPFELEKQIVMEAITACVERRPR